MLRGSSSGFRWQTGPTQKHQLQPWSTGLFLVAFGADSRVADWFRPWGPSGGCKPSLPCVTDGWPRLKTTKLAQSFEVMGVSRPSLRLRGNFKPFSAPLNQSNDCQVIVGCTFLCGAISIVFIVSWSFAVYVNKPALVGCAFFTCKQINRRLSAGFYELRSITLTSIQKSDGLRHKLVLEFGQISPLNSGFEICLRCTWNITK